MLMDHVMYQAAALSGEVHTDATDLQRSSEFCAIRNARLEQFTCD